MFSEPNDFKISQEKLKNFEKYVPRQALSRFMARYELFKLQLNIKGCIVECGVHHGGGLMGWAKMSSALEPYSLDRRVFGFDTFEGFPSVSDKDTGEVNKNSRLGGLCTSYDVHGELLSLINEYDENRFLNEFQKIFLVKGDACKTIPVFVEENPYLLISLLFLDFDLYEPTKVALENLLPRMPKGAVLAFDELNNPWWPGETQAALESIDINKKEIKRFSFDPSISYIVL
ncbi:TylF/MycF/NovP-related O-methyltransferase [Marinospirillum perlucidum]|uniref:TylF/MycF/NovP-related O-methyltransferase n=1 Tax=Marinospirillum perlucidum TaxID=1982602 RepID=UPI000DF426E8|nr:TylF/MycF/NovP-related O-methyltransferase [Marinospirillum perlucidum]